MSPKKPSSRVPRNDTISTNSSDQMTQDMSIENRLMVASQLESELLITKDKSSSQQSSKPNGNDKSDEHLIRTQLCGHLCEVLVTDPATSLRRDCVHRLWRGCFYPQINSLRTRLMKEKQRQKKTKVPNDAIKNVEKSLNTFLVEAIQLYTYIVTSYMAKLKEIQTEGIVPSLHRLLIHLGDLHRYSNETDKAESCYMKASILAPGRGNPYNQLAVVSQQPNPNPNKLPQTCTSLFWYVRSLLATYEPFDTSRANMARLFESNRSWLKNTSLPDPPLQDDKIPKKKFMELQRQYNAKLTRHFLAEFVKLHGIFFSSNHDYDEITSQSGSIIAKFSQYLQDQFFGEALIRKMVVINVFSYSLPGKSPLALSFALSFGAALAAQISSNLQNIDDNAETLMIRLLAPLLLFCEWLNCLDQLSPSDEKDLCEPYHEQALSRFWKEISKLANQLQSVRSKFFSDTFIPPKQTLREHEQFKGFGPFVRFIDHSPRSSYFKENCQENSNGFLIKTDAINALERYKLSLSGVTGNETEVRMRVTMFFSFVQKWSCSTSDAITDNINKYILFDEETQKYSLYEKNKIVAPNHETVDNNISQDDILDDNIDQDDDDEEEDFIVYNGTESYQPQAKAIQTRNDQTMYQHDTKVPKIASPSFTEIVPPHPAIGISIDIPGSKNDDNGDYYSLENAKGIKESPHVPDIDMDNDAITDPSSLDINKNVSPSKPDKSVDTSVAPNVDLEELMAVASDAPVTKANNSNDVSPFDINKKISETTHAPHITINTNNDSNDIDVEVPKQVRSDLAPVEESPKPTSSSVCENSAPISSTKKPINPPPGFDVVPRNDHPLPNVSINHFNVPLAGLSSHSDPIAQEHKLSSLLEVKDCVDHVMLPVNILDSIGISKADKTVTDTFPKAPLPPPGFSRLSPPDDGIFSNYNLSRETFPQDRFGSSSLLFGSSSHSLFSPHQEKIEQQNNNNMDVTMESNIPTLNPFLTPYGNNNKTIGNYHFPGFNISNGSDTNNAIRVSLEELRDGDLQDDNKRNNEIPLPSGPQYASTYGTWNPFM